MPLQKRYYVEKTKSIGIIAHHTKIAQKLRNKQVAT